MKIHLGIIFAVVAVLISGCATVHQLPVAMSSSSVGTQAGRVGIAMAPLPKPELQVPGADCLLCLAFAYAANSSLNTYSQTLSADDLLNIKNEFAKSLRKKGTDVIVIDEPINVAALPDFGTRTPNVAVKNFASLQQKYQIDKLLLVEVSALGFTRSYSAYIPTSDPKAMLRGQGYLVNLKTNVYEWYEPVFIIKSADQVWNAAAKFPGLTNAYFQVLEMTRDRLLEPMSYVKASDASTSTPTSGAALKSQP